MIDSSDLVHFTDEEGYGKYLDLHEIYDMYVNLKQMEVCGFCGLMNDTFNEMIDVLYIVD